MLSWIIGGNADCDVVVDSPIVSARHCQLTQRSEGFLLNDLGSTNGTYVNGVRIAGPIHIKKGDAITLGRTVPFPWPSELTRTVRIGRLGDNDIVLDDARVSGHHARLVVVQGFQTSIEDLGSSNGTFLNSADRRLTSLTPITASDTLYFGTLEVPAARLLSAPIKPETTEPVQSIATAIGESQVESLPRPPSLGVPERHRWLLAWSAQAPVLAILIVLMFGRQAGPTTGDLVGQGIAATTFALALAAIWLGCSLAAADVAAGRSNDLEKLTDPVRRASSLGKRVAVLASLCALGCSVLLALVYWGSGLKASWMTMWGVLALSSLVGFFFGLAVSISVRDKTAMTAVLLICFALMVILGGWIQPVPQMSLPLQYVAEAMPSRWAFEALFMLELGKHQAMSAAAESEPASHQNLVEKFFPAASEQMGIRADATALVSMLIGLMALSAFISVGPRTGP